MMNEGGGVYFLLLLHLEPVDWRFFILAGPFWSIHLTGVTGRQNR